MRRIARDRRAGERRAAEGGMMFRYTEQQWANIQRELQRLPKFEPGFETYARAEIEIYAEYYFNQMKVDIPYTRKALAEKRSWIDCQKSLSKSAALIRSAIDAHNADRQDYGQAYCERIADVAMSLTKLEAFVGDKAGGAPVPPSDPNTHRRVLHVQILGLWTALGGKLKFSRNPNVAGPLARFFTAAATPLHNFSVETLPDIVKRQRKIIAAASRSPSKSQSRSRQWDSWRLGLANQHCRKEVNARFANEKLPIGNGLPA